MEYDKTAIEAALINKDIHIEKIVTIYYREFTSVYRYAGERHPFWEMVYVDTGEVDIIADSLGYRLKRGDIIFHKPDEFHAISATGEEACNLIIISFVCCSESISFFENKMLNLSNDKRNLIADILMEAKNIYAEDLGPLYLNINRREKPILGAEQLLYGNLEKLLIYLYRLNSEPINAKRISGVTKNRIESEFVEQIIHELSKNLDKNLKLVDICNKFYMSKTQLKTMFKKNTGYSVISYYNNLKMEEAKRLIRLGSYKFTEISKRLGFETVHYFSASFKNHFNMSPTEYYSSVKAMEDGTNSKET